MAKICLGPWHFLVLHLIFTFFVWLIFRFGLQFRLLHVVVNRTPMPQHFWLSIFGSDSTFSAFCCCCCCFFCHRPLCRSLVSWLSVRCCSRHRRRCRSSVSVIVAISRWLSQCSHSFSLSLACLIALLHFTHCALFSSALLGRFSAESFFLLIYQPLAVLPVTCRLPSWPPLPTRLSRLAVVLISNRLCSYFIYLLSVLGRFSYYTKVQLGNMRNRKFKRPLIDMGKPFINIRRS